MTTEVSKFKDAYATITVATYEPLILRWISGWALKTIASTLATRTVTARAIRDTKGLSTAHAITSAFKAARVDRLPSVKTMTRAVEAGKFDIASGDDVLERLGAKPVGIRNFRRRCFIVASFIRMDFRSKHRAARRC